MFRHLEKRFYEPINPYSLSNLSKSNTWLIQRMHLMRNLEAHRGCVNSVVWDDKGNIILSGSDDQHLVISDPWTGKIVSRLSTPHRANIFSAKFVPETCNQQIISCSGDGMIIYTDLNRLEESHSSKFTCNTGTCYDVLTLPGYPHVFLSCGEDGTVRWFDLRTKTNCTARACHEDILLSMGRAVTAIAVNPMNQVHLAVATPDSIIRIFDRRMLGTRAQDSYLEESNRALLMHLRPDSLEGKGHRVTSLRYSSRGDQLLASYSSDYLYLFDPQNVKEMPLESISGETSPIEDDERGASGPTLKRLRLRGDWSDTGPQAVPESELRNQPGDVGQARPALQSTLMQRMTDILARLLQNPNARASGRQSISEPITASSAEENADIEGGSGGAIGDSHFQSSGDIASDNVSSSGVPNNEDDNNEANQPRETNSAPPSIASPISGPIIDLPIVPRLDITSDMCPPRESESPVSAYEIVPPEPPPEETRTIQSTETFPCSSSVEGVPLPAESSRPYILENHPLAEPMEVDGSTKISESPSFDETEPSPSTIAKTDSSMEGLLKVPKVIPPNDADSSSQATGTVTPDSPINSSMQTTISGVQDTFSFLREDFKHKHAVEPSVNIMYSGQGTTSGLISLGVGDEISRDYQNSDEARDSPQMDRPSEADQDQSMVQPLDEATSVQDTQEGESPIPNINLEQEPSFSTPKGIAEAVCPLNFSQEGACAISPGPAPADESKPSSTKSGPSSSTGKRKSPRKETPSEDPENDDDTTTRRSRLARLNRAINRHVQQVRADEARRIDGPPDRTIPRCRDIQQYKGHRNARTMIKEVCFWGDDHVMSGSDCGRVFVWERKSGRLVMLWEADRHVVNCLQPHPYMPVLATSGIDYDVKLWAPLSRENRFDEEQAIEIAHRNEALLAETRDTITVPATFMIRMLASLNQLRQDRNRSQNQNQDEDEEHAGD